MAWGAATTNITPRAAGAALVFGEVNYIYVPVTGFSPGFSHIAATGRY